MERDTGQKSKAPVRPVDVRTDDRVRLMGAVLAATDYPIRSQARKKHGTHAHARSTRKRVAEFNHHPAVHAMQVLLDQGVGLPAIMSYAMRLTMPGFQPDEEAPRWVPPRWHEHLAHFHETTQLVAWWKEENGEWDTALRHLRESFAPVDMYRFFEPFFDEVVETLVFMPNIGDPTDQTLGFRLGGQLVTIMPPPMAWGDSPPWPYKDDPGLAFRAAIQQYGGLLLDSYMQMHEPAFALLSEKPLPIDDKYLAAHPVWRDHFGGLLRAALTGMFLEDAVGALEAKSFVQQLVKGEGLTVLPSVVNMLRRYVDDFRSGKYAAFIDYLRIFPKQLKIAKTIGAR